MGELYNPFPKLPKNIRQVGEGDQSVKLYVEDYVNTYLKRLYPVSGQDLRVGLLLGSLELNDGTPYIFIDGAMEMEGVTEEGRKVVFSESDWKKAYKNVEQLFPRREIQGWFLCGAPGDELSPLNYWKQHVQYFQGPNQLMYLNNGMEGEETVYITSEDGFYKLRGYSIYYERNQMMQDYMVLRKEVRRVESGADDEVIHQFKKKMDERKHEVVERKQTVGLLKGVCMAMSVVILAGGIVMFGNYRKMRDMESVIASAIPEKAETFLMGNNKETGKESHVIIEEADGEVYPTKADVKKETMSEAAPGDGTGNISGDGTGNISGDGADNTPGDGAASAAGQSGTTEQGTAGGQESMADQSGAVSQPGASGQKTADGQGGVISGGNKTAGQSDDSGQSGTSSVSIGAGTDVHIVQDGETLYGICFAKYHSVNRLAEICKLNGLEDENKIVAGQQLLLP